MFKKERYSGFHVRSNILEIFSQNFMFLTVIWDAVKKSLPMGTVRFVIYLDRRILKKEQIFYLEKTALFSEIYSIIHRVLRVQPLDLSNLDFPLTSFEIEPNHVKNSVARLR